jgi:hypothetical protein
MARGTVRAEGICIFHLSKMEVKKCRADNDASLIALSYHTNENSRLTSGVVPLTYYCNTQKTSPTVTLVNVSVGQYNE